MSVGLHIKNGPSTPVLKKKEVSPNEVGRNAMASLR